MVFMVVPNLLLACIWSVSNPVSPCKLLWLCYKSLRGCSPLKGDGGGTFYSSLVTHYSLLLTRCSLETYSLLSEKSLITRCITCSLSLQNLLVSVQKLTRYHYKPTRYNSKPTRYNSKPTRYHLKTYSLLFKNLAKIHQRFFL